MTYRIFRTIKYGWRPRIWLNWRWLNATRPARGSRHVRPMVIAKVLLNFSNESRLCVRTSMRRRHVLSPQDLGRACLSADRREPPRGRSGAPAGDRHARTFRGSAGERPTGAAVALGGAVRSQGHDAERGRR